MSSNLCRPIVHIGLGKTATTSLQRNVFPNIPSIRDEVIYNDKALLAQLHHRNVMTPKEEEIFQTAFRSVKNFISDEALGDWNPRNWKVAAEKNLRLFGHNTTIVITVRQTESYLCSVYQQMVHAGNVWSPVEFFVNRAEFDRMIPFLPPLGLIKFDVDSFDLELLYQLYSERFKKVVIVPLSAVNELEFAKKIFNLNDEELNFLKSKMKTGRIYNRSYSKSAMALTMKREELLNSIGLMSSGTAAREIINRTDSALRDLTFVEKLRSFPWRIIKRILRALRWRAFIQKCFDRIVPYKKYNLPDNIYRNRELARKNDNFIKTFE
ncbi:MAG: hypothetical protein HN519_00850 [Hellea sp.]|jgi:hypothetical protein|nr:hypothetical protein [Hellea sp.]